MNFFDVLKSILAIGIDVGTGVVVGHYAKAAVTTAKGLEKLCVCAATTAVSGYIGARASEWVNEQIDLVANAVNLNKSESIKESMKDV